jgi:hypothetical protein
MMATAPNIQFGNIPSPYEVRKYVIDYRQLPICVEHIIETGFLKKRYIYYHNYGDFISIVIVTTTLTGATKIKKYTYSVEKRRRHNKVDHPKNNMRQYVS